MEHTEAQAARALARTVRGSPTATLLTGDSEAHAVPIALTPQGQIVTAAPAVVLEAPELVLHCPDERPDAAQLMIACEHIDPDADARADRFLALHLIPKGSVMLVAEVLSARLAEAVLDADAIELANPLASAEQGLLRELNADPERLCSFIEGQAEGDEVRAVSVDPDGVTLRTRLGPARIVFLPPTETEDAAREAVDAMMRPPGEDPA